VRAAADRRHLAAADQLTSGETEVPAYECDVVRGVDLARPGDTVELGPDVRGGPLDGEAGKRRGAAGAGRAGVRRGAGVGAPDGAAVRLDADLLCGDLGKRRPRPLTHLRRTDEDDDAPVRLEAADGARDRVGAGGEEPHGDAAPYSRPLRLVPADRGC